MVHLEILSKLKLRALLMQFVGSSLWYPLLHGVMPFFEINLTSKLLQNNEVDLNSATSQLQVTKNYLVGCRCDQGFQQVLTDATEIAKELEILLKLRQNKLEKGERNGSLSMRPKKRHYKIKSRNSK